MSREYNSQLLLFIADILHIVKTKKFYVCETGIGPFYITQQLWRYSVFFNNINLGDFTSASQAAEALASGITFKLYDSYLGELDTSTLGIPSALSFWICVPGGF